MRGWGATLLQGASYVLRHVLSAGRVPMHKKGKRSETGFGPCGCQVGQGGCWASAAGGWDVTVRLSETSLGQVSASRFSERLRISLHFWSLLGKKKAVRLPATYTLIHAHVYSFLIEESCRSFLCDGLFSARPPATEGQPDDARQAQTHEVFSALCAGGWRLNPGGGGQTVRPRKDFGQRLFGWAGGGGGRGFGSWDLGGAGQAEAGQGVQSPVWVHHHVNHWDIGSTLWNDWFPC